MNTGFHVAGDIDDYNAFSSLWPAKFGPLENNYSAQRLIADAFRAGSAILARRPDGTPLAATVLDLDSYGSALFVPFILITASVSNRAAVRRRVLELILRTFDVSRVERLLFVTDDGRDYRAAVADFNEVGAKAGLAAVLKIIGDADNLYGDRRKVILHQLFIPSTERPEVPSAPAALPAAESAAKIKSVREARSVSGAAGIGAQVLSNRLMSEACCSGCSEKVDKEFKEAKDKENKEGVERFEQFGKINVENMANIILFTQIGIDVADKDGQKTSSPLV
jgi:hypothetical protein